MTSQVIDLSELSSGNIFDFEKLILTVEKIVKTHNDDHGCVINYINLALVPENRGLSPDDPGYEVCMDAVINLVYATAYRAGAEFLGSHGDREAIETIHQKYSDSMKLTDRVVDAMDLPINIEQLLFAANREWDYVVILASESGAPKITVRAADIIPKCDSCGVEMYPAGRHYICGLCGEVQKP